MTTQKKPPTKAAGKKLSRIDVRMTEKEKNRIKMLADRFAGGNVSLWITYAALECPRVHLVKPEESK